MFQIHGLGWVTWQNSNFRHYFPSCSSLNLDVYWKHRLYMFHSHIKAERQCWKLVLESHCVLWLLKDQRALSVFILKDERSSARVTIWVTAWPLNEQWRTSLRKKYWLWEQGVKVNFCALMGCAGQELGRHIWCSFSSFVLWCTCSTDVTSRVWWDLLFCFCNRFMNPCKLGTRIRWALES